MAGRDPFGIGAGRNPFGVQNANPFGTKTGPSTSVPMPRPDTVGDIGGSGEPSHTDAIASPGSDSAMALPDTDVIGDAGRGDEACPGDQIGPSGSDASHGQLDPMAPTGVTNDLRIPDATRDEED